MICAGDFISEYCIQTLHGTNLGQGIFAFYLLRAQTSGSRLPQGTAGDVCRLWYAPPSSAVVGVVHHAVFSVLRIGVHLDTVIFREPRMQHRLGMAAPQNCAVQESCVFKAVRQAGQVDCAPLPYSCTAICTSFSRCTRISVPSSA